MLTSGVEGWDFRERDVELAATDVGLRLGVVLGDLTNDRDLVVTNEALCQPQPLILIVLDDAHL